MVSKSQRTIDAVPWRGYAACRGSGSDPNPDPNLAHPEDDLAVFADARQVRAVRRPGHGAADGPVARRSPVRPQRAAALRDDPRAQRAVAAGRGQQAPAAGLLPDAEHVA